MNCEHGYHADCPFCKDQMIALLTQGRDRAQAQCGEMRSALLAIWRDVQQHKEYPPKEVVGPMIAHALSTDCGREYFHVGQLEATLYTLREVLHNREGCVDLVRAEISRIEALKDSHP